MKRPAILLMLSVTALIVLGMVMLYSSSMTDKGAGYLAKQSVWLVLGLTACLTTACMDYRKIRDLAPWILAFVLLLLVLVLIPHIGSIRNGSRRWFAWGSVSFQPSELAKLGLVLALAWYGDRHRRAMNTFKKGALIPGCIVGTVAGLVLLEKDLGTTMLLACVGGAVMLFAGTRLHWVALMGLMALLVGVAYVKHNKNRSDRIESWLNPEKTKSAGGYQSWHATVAIGAGGTTGLGLGNGRQKMGFVPENHTDFIFSVVGEELGMAAGMGVLAVYTLLMISGVWIAMRAADSFGFLLASGLTILIALQAAINIGVVTSVLPNKGLALPFVSYGGSSILCMLTGVGLLLSVARNGSVPANEEVDVLERPELVSP